MKVRFHEKPKLETPSMVAGWPGMGFLAKLSVDYLVQRLEAKPFAEIRVPRNDIYFKGGIGKLGVDKHQFYYWRGNELDLILCSGRSQPRSLETIYKLGDKVLGIAQEFNVTSIYTFAAVPHPYEEKPRVVGVVNRAGLKAVLKEHGVKVVENEGRITGLNGVLIGVARERGIDGVCLLCEINYLNIPQPRSSKTALETLTELLGLHVDLSGLDQQAEEVERKVKKLKKSKAPKERGPKELGYIS